MLTVPCVVSCTRVGCRYGLEFVDVSAAVAGCGCRVFDAALSSGGVVKAIRVPDGKRISNSRLKAPKGDVVAEAVAAGVLPGGLHAQQHAGWPGMG